MSYIFIAKKGNQKVGRIVSSKQITSASNSRKRMKEYGYRVSPIHKIRIPRAQRRRRRS